MRHHRFIVAIAGLVLTAVVGLAQDPFGADPFGQDAFGPVGGNPPAGGQPDDLPAAPSPHVKQLLEYSRRGHIEFAEAISSLARIGQWQEADRLLSGLAGKGLDVPARAEVAKRIGPALFLRIRGNEQMSPGAQAALDDLAEASAAHFESPERLRQAIKGLASPSTDTRLAAGRVLLEGGNTAIKELVNAAIGENSDATRDEMLRVMLKLGDGGSFALRQLALYGTPQVRARAMSALIRISREQNFIELLTTAYASDSSEQERDVALAALRQSGNLADQSTALKILQLDFEATYDATRLMANDDESIVLWSVNSDLTGVGFQSTKRLFASYRDVLDAGARLRRVGGLSPVLESEVLAADLAYRIMIDPDWGDPPQVEEVRRIYGPLAEPSALSAAMKRALDVDDHAAAIGLIRMIDPASATILDRNLLLNGQGATPTPLVRAASCAEPQVRYEAALVAANLGQGAPFPDSSQVMRCLSEMRSLTSGPKAIVVETRADTLIQLKSLLRAYGYQVEVASTVAEAERMVASGGDLRIILAKTELADLPAIEMIDRIRRMERGRLVPMVFYGHEVAGFTPARWPAPTILIAQPVSPPGLYDVMQDVQRRRRLPQLSQYDRHAFQQSASQTLGRLLGESTTEF